MRSSDRINRILPILALILIALVGIWMWPKSDDSSESRGEQSATGSPSYGSLSGEDSGSGRAKSLGRERKKTEQREPTHTVDQLNSFYLENLSSEGCTLEAALNLALDEYYRVCAATGESAQAIVFELDGTPEGPLNFKFKNVPFWQTVSHLCALGGMRIVSTGTTTKVAALEDNGDQITRVWAVPPNFGSRISRWTVDDPFGDAPPNQLLDHLVDRGILKGDDSAAAMDPSSGRFTISGTARDLHRMQTLHDLEVVSPVMIRTKATMVEVPAGTEIETGLFPAADARRMLTELLEVPDTSITSEPLVLFQPGENSNITTSIPTEIGGAEPAVSQQLQISGQFTGFQLQTSVRSSAQVVVGDRVTSSRRLATSFHAPPGEWFIAATGAPGEATQYVFYESTAIDPAQGFNSLFQPIPEPGPAPVPNQPLDSYQSPLP